MIKTIITVITIIMMKLIKMLMMTTTMMVKIPYLQDV